MIRSAFAHIDLTALQHNFKRVKQIAANSQIMAVIKADAYGHGLVQVAQALSVPDSAADAFAVAHINEALILREAGIDTAILVLQGFQNPEQLKLMQANNLWPVIHQHWQVQQLLAVDVNTHIWLKVDTGMGRLGFAMSEIESVWQKLNQSRCVQNITLMSHFANADELEQPLNSQQIKSFQQLALSLKTPSSLCNSAGIINFKQSHADWVRPGIMLYGSSPVKNRSAQQLDLQPVMILKSTLIAINQKQAGDFVGYGSEFKCPQNMPVGIVAIGYGDAYSRMLGAKADVFIAGQRAAIIGRVSMDMLCIDLSHITDIQLGAEVELCGENIRIDELAQSAQTIAYELLCNMSKCVN